MISGKQYVCGKCGQVGHNRRTCGKTIPTPNTPTSQSPPPHPQSSPTSTTLDLDEAIRVLRGDTTEPAAEPVAEPVAEPEPTPETETALEPAVALEPETVTVAEPVVETMTAEDIETWWMLTSGKNGKRQLDEKRRYGTLHRRATVTWDDEDTDRLITMLNLAITQGATPKAIRKFLNYFGTEARTRIAQDERTPERVLAVLTKDPSTTVRQTLALRPDLTANLTETLSSDKDYLTRLRIAKRRNVPGDVLEKIFREQEQKKPTPTNLKYRAGYNLTYVIAAHPNTPAHLRQEFLTSDKKDYVRNALNNPNTTADEIVVAWERNKNNSYGYVAEGIMKHPNTPSPVLAEYLEERIFNVTYTGNYYHTIFADAVRHQHMPPDLIDRVARYITNDPNAFKKFAGTIIPIVVHHPHTSDDTLKFLRTRYRNTRIGEQAGEKLEHPQ